MNEFACTGPLKDEMCTFILLKRSVGNKYETEVGILKRFDRYLGRNYPAVTGLSKDAVTGWCAKQPHEKPANQCSRASVIRQFAKYLDSTGRTAYILPDNHYPLALNMYRTSIRKTNCRGSLRKQINAISATNVPGDIWSCLSSSGSCLSADCAVPRRDFWWSAMWTSKEAV